VKIPLPDHNFSNRFWKSYWAAGLAYIEIDQHRIAKQSERGAVNTPASSSVDFRNALRYESILFVYAGRMRQTSYCLHAAKCNKFGCSKDPVADSSLDRPTDRPTAAAGHHLQRLLGHTYSTLPVSVDSVVELNPIVLKYSKHTVQHSKSTSFRVLRSHGRARAKACYHV
jgi:hypothetical protein